MTSLQSLSRSMNFWPVDFVVDLHRDRGGVALIEFAIGLPVLLLLSLTGAELTNYVTVKMRVSQLALHLADNASRIGEGSLLSAKQISETDINDVLTGAGLQAGDLNIFRHGRVIVSSLEPKTSPNSKQPKFKIAWQRCRGAAVQASLYGTTDDTDLDGMGPDGQQVTASDGNATIFVEVRYEYQPIVGASLAPSTTIDEIASMAVRDRRDLTRIYNNEDAPVSSC